MGKRRETLCWQCENAVPNHKGRGCEWSRNFQPVPGWTVKEPQAEDECEGYFVTVCPKFRREVRRK